MAVKISMNVLPFSGFRVLVYLFCIALLLNTTYASAEKHTDYGIEITTGIKYGDVQELVFQNESRISKLIWEQKFSPDMGLNLSFKIWNFFLDASINNTFPIKSGIIKDFDYVLSNSDAVSHYSQHSAYLDKDFALQAKIGYRIKIHSVFSIFPVIGFTYQNRKWSAADGYVQYPVIEGTPWTGEEVKQKVAAGRLKAGLFFLYLKRLIPVLNFLAVIKTIPYMETPLQII